MGRVEKKWGHPSSWNGLSRFWEAARVQHGVVSCIVGCDPRRHPPFPNPAALPRGSFGFWLHLDGDERHRSSHRCRGQSAVGRDRKGSTVESKQSSPGAPSATSNILDKSSSLMESKLFGSTKACTRDVGVCEAPLVARNRTIRRASLRDL